MVQSRWLSLFTFTVLLPVVEAFVPRHSISMQPRRMALAAIPMLDVSPSFVDVTYFSSSALAQSPSLLLSDAMDIAKNVLIGVGGTVVVLLAVTFLLSSFIIPKAAEQLELSAKSLDPALWDEYARKLEPGEVLAMRPDLMQELGQKVQVLTMAKFDEMQAQMEQAKKENPGDGSPRSGTAGGTASSGPPRGDVVDVEITSKKWDD